MNSIKILYVCALFGGGRERRCAQLIKGLSSNPNFVLRIISVSDKIEYLDEEPGMGRIVVIDNRDKNVISQEIEQTIEAFRPDIVHMWLDEPRYFLPIIKYKNQYKYKVIIGSLADGNYVPYLSKANLANQISYIFADAIVSNTYFALKQKHAPQNKAHVIYNGFDFSRIPINVDVEAKKRELGITTRYVCMMCARFTPGKDYESFINLAELAQNKKMDVTFLAVGEGPLMPKSKSMVIQKGLNNIRFLGRRNDIELLFQICDSSILLTDNNLHQEGISNAIMESMASGVPVIATDGGGTPEIIKSGINGYLVSSRDYHKALFLLSNILNNEHLRLKMSQEAISTIKQGFLLPDMASRYVGLYIMLSK